jgi:spermidine/putrescine transport system substrate-binding protein
MREVKMTKTWYSDLPQYYQNQIRAAGLDASGMARRRVLKGLAGAAVGAGLLGLNSQSSRAAASEMTYMCWEGYNDPRIIDPFKAANDVGVAYDLIVDSPGGFAKLQAGASREVDLVSSDMPWITRMGPAGLAMELNPDNFSDVNATFYDQFKAPFAPLVNEGKTFGVPTRWGWVGASYNTDFTKAEEWRSYDPVFDAKYKDKICVMDWGDWPILPMALYAGINPYDNLDAKALEEVRKVLRAVFKNTRTLVGDVTQAQKGLLDGSLIGCVGAGSYITSALRKQGHKNIFSSVPEPKNGLKQGIIWVEATAILKETDQPDLAQKLLKHVVSKESGYILSLLDTTCNFVTNKAVEELYTADERDILQTDYMWKAWENSEMHRIAPNIDDMLAIWQEELAAAK